LFRKAGIVRCYSREELTTVGCIFTLPELKGKNFAIITHAGGPGVMLTDALSKGGLNVPKLEGPVAEELKGKLFPGAAVGNPIDILATGTPEHLCLCLEYCEEKFDNIDAVMAIFGTPGLVICLKCMMCCTRRCCIARSRFFRFFLPSIRREPRLPLSWQRAM